jgi:D-ribose pyranose/furanose isomerase RbsD
MKKAAVVIKDKARQYEGLRVSLGMLLEDIEVQMFVLCHEIAEMDEAYRENMQFLDEMGGERFSDHQANAEKYGFQYLTFEQITDRLRKADVIIPL